ncbi:alpha/beta fold hydrolase [Rhodobacteraceae bacterium N5(2021)]|uniref:Alpha/beta fold hydrolase n=1 Tax=Gymnodinialimonas phycosphaerae TaxID=2841589 RepID=A0A975YFG9_9RHOB|nr:alpha/beta fold hydrolase [Gymnodinialimonas phycosphaerae]MBY4894797.1 alpha/beta fold hydrolase [Gymnodinialimonas phycosphaerae]
MLSQTPILTAAVLAAAAFSTAAHGTEVFRTGLMELRVADDARPLDGFLWYPTEAEDGLVRAHGNAVWEAIRVIPHAAPAEGLRPLVVLSHGMYGNARNQAWLAAELSQAGYIVAAIDHPGTSTFLRDPDDAREMWERPRDITRTIDHILADAAVGPQVDPDRIYMAGHSLGGLTAVMLAGARYDPARIDAFCADGADDLVCGILSMWDVAQSEADRVTIAQDCSDPRLAGIAVFDLGGTQAFAPESFATIETPMLVIGAPIANSGLNLDLESRALVEMLPEGTPYLEPETLAHFDFLGVCTAQGLDILREEEPDDTMVCEDGTDARRAEHAMIAQAVISFFEAH